jgi:hypothetical protein
MSFIEKLSGISPDGGNGSTELMIAALLVSIFIAAAWLWPAKQCGRNGGLTR